MADIASASNISLHYAHGCQRKKRKTKGSNGGQHFSRTAERRIPAQKVSRFQGMLHSSISTRAMEEADADSGSVRALWGGCAGL